MSSELSPLGPGEELIDVESFQRLHSRTPVAKPGWRSVSLDASSNVPSPAAAPEIELVDRLTRSDVERTAVQRARAHADAAAFFLARQGRIQATCCDPEPPWDLAPIHWSGTRFALAAVLEQRKPYCGAPWRDALTSRIARSLGREGVRQIALLPIAVFERPVAFLYADAGRNPFETRSLKALLAIGSEIAGIFERMLVERKRDQPR